jgi:hypothetical protein
LIDERVASAYVDFLAFSPPAFTERLIIFTDWSESFRVSQAIKQNTEALLPLPQLSLSINAAT